MIQFLPQWLQGCHFVCVCSIQNSMRWTIFSILVIVSQNVAGWYPEHGAEISGVGSYDTTDRQFMLIAFNRVDNCGTVSLWLDRSLFNHSESAESNIILVKLAVDNFQSWMLQFDIKESKHWLPHSRVLNQKIPTGLLKQLGTGKMLTVSDNQRKYTWDLSGSSLAMKSAYQACVN